MPMPDAFREALRRRLWPIDQPADLLVWALLDGARDERIFPLVRDCGLSYAPLYSGNLPMELRRVAPYLVELDPGDPYTNRILELTWGNAWGIFIKAESQTRLRHHLKGLLRVRNELGKFMLFRYYDPRVLRQYLPTCRYDELRTVFGPIREFITEAKDPDELLTFSLDGPRLQQLRTPLGRLDGDEPVAPHALATDAGAPDPSAAGPAGPAAP